MNKRRILSVVLSGMLAFAGVFHMGVFAEELSSGDFENVILENELETGEENADFVDPEIETNDNAFIADDLLTSGEELGDEAFIRGYVRVKKETTVYSSISGLEEKGFFTDDAVVFAAEKISNVETGVEWVRIVFDTEEIKAAQEEASAGYVEADYLTALTDEEIQILTDSLQYEENVRSYEEYLLPSVSFEFRAAENAEIDIEEVLSAGASALVITEQPVNVTAAIGDAVVFTVRATGAVSYQWMYSANNGTKWYNCGVSQGGQTDTLRTSANANRYTLLYRCTLTDGNGNQTYSDVVRMIEPGTFEITEQPADVTAAIGDPVVFTVKATGAAGYQWMYSANNGTKWYNCGVSQGAQTDTLTTSANANRYALLYRCTVTDNNGEQHYTDIVRMIEPGAFEITEQPVNVEAAIGDPVVFTVKATGVVSYQWQYTSNGTRWYNCGVSQGSQTDTLSTSANSSRYAFEYRCTLTDENGEEHYSDIVRMIEPVSFEITEQPVDVEAAIGDPVAFTVKATGAAGYQWMYSANNGEKWYNCGVSQGAHTDTLTTSANANRYTLVYRCTVTDNNGEEHFTDIVKMIEPVSFEITEQPTDVTAEIGAPVVFAVKATGAVSYQWMYSGSEGAKWYNCAVSQGAQTDTLSTSANANRYTFIYRCTLTDANGEEHYSDIVRMIEPESFEITEQPVDVVAAVGDPVVFTVKATGVDSYQWQYTSNGTSWYNCGTSQGAKTNTLTTSATEARYAFEYRCTLTDNNGEKHYSAAVKMVKPGIVIDDVTYERLTDTTCIVVSYSGSASSLTIPEIVEGMTVTEIGEEAFMDNATLESIDLPDTIVVIRARAFKNCSSLRDMH